MNDPSDWPEPGSAKLPDWPEPEPTITPEEAIATTLDIAKAATPEHAQGWQNAYLKAFPRTIQDRARRDDHFRAELLAARHILIDLLRQEGLRRCFEPNTTPIYQKGLLVDYKIEYDNKLLITMLERLAPEEFHLPSRLQLENTDGTPVRFIFPLAETALELEAGDSGDSEP